MGIVLTQDTDNCVTWSPNAFSTVAIWFEPSWICWSSKPTKNSFSSIEHKKPNQLATGEPSRTLCKWPSQYVADITLHDVNSPF